MSNEARELHRIIRASVHDMLDAYRIQAQAGPVSAQALEGIIFRATHPVVDRLAPYPAAERAALLPNVVRLLLASFLEDVAGADGTEEGRGAVTHPEAVGALYASGTVSKVTVRKWSGKPCF